MNIEHAYRMLALGALVWFCLLILVMLIRAISGPRVTDRILSINMIGTMVISSICILSFMLEESYLLDVALLYAMISFIAVLILSATYIPKDPTRRKFILLEGLKASRENRIVKGTGKASSKGQIAGDAAVSPREEHITGDAIVSTREEQITGDAMIPAREEENSPDFPAADIDEPDAEYEEEPDFASEDTDGSDAEYEEEPDFASADTDVADAEYEEESDVSAADVDGLNDGKDGEGI